MGQQIKAIIHILRQNNVVFKNVVKGAHLLWKMLFYKTDQ